MHERKQNEVDGGIVQLESLLNATVDKDFDKFEIYTLRNILAVGHEEEQLAPWVRLEHYKNLDLEAAERESGLSVEEVQMRRRKLQETAKLNAMLKAEEARNAAVMAQLEGLLGNGSAQQEDSPFAFLTSGSTALATNQPLNQNTQYALSQLPALRQLLQQLKDSLQTLPNARHAKEDPESTDAKRRRYVESQSRRALGRKGIEAENGEALAASSGRRIGRDEVEGMEAVVQALRGAREDRMEE